VENESRQHFARAIRRFCQSDPNRLMVWGGDGTANEAINMFMQESRSNPDLLEIGTRPYYAKIFRICPEG